MKKTVSKLFALLLASSVVLSGCNSSTGETSGEKTDGESTTAQNEQTEGEQDAQSSADEITDLVIPTRSAILLATRIPSAPSNSSNI